jgi:hypothetical protein
MSSEYRIKRHPLCKQDCSARSWSPSCHSATLCKGSFLTSTSLHDSDRKVHYKSSRFRTLTTEHFDCDPMKAIDSLAQRFLECVLKFESGDWRAGLGGWSCEVKLLPLRNLELEQAVRNEVIRRPYFQRPSYFGLVKVMYTRATRRSIVKGI